VNDTTDRDEPPTWAFYSDDGLQGASKPEPVLVDPIDGTRMAAAGFEMACREAGAPSDAAARPLDARPVLGSSAAHRLACIAAGDRELQDSLSEVVQRCVRDLRDRRSA